MNPQNDSAWDSFWRDTREQAAYKQDSPLDGALAQFWTKLFIEEIPAYSQPRILDLVCGNGVVTQFAHDAITHLGTTRFSIHCVDYSPAAIAAVARRFSSVTGVVSDAKYIPFGDASFDIVVSQFGLEYAGIEAFAEAARLVRAGGRLAAIIHLKDGAIYRENLSNKNAIAQIQQSHVLSCFDAYAEAFFSAQRGPAGAAAVQQADNRLALAVKKLEQVLNTFGVHIAGGAAYALHSDLAHIYGGLPTYRPEDIRAWTKKHTAELEHYARRMSSMLHAAMDDDSIGSAIKAMEQHGLSMSRQEPLIIGNDALPAAWVLVGVHEKQV